MNKADCLEESLGTLPLPKRAAPPFSQEPSPWVVNLGRTLIAALVPVVVSYLAREARPFCRGNRGGRGGCRVVVVAGGMDEPSPPSIKVQPQSGTFDGVNPFTLSVDAVGDGTLTYQWYVGAAGDATNPMEDGLGPEVAVTPSEITEYWVRVSNDYGFVDSETATVTVEG
jgi:hypothetical protein